MYSELNTEEPGLQHPLRPLTKSKSCCSTASLKCGSENRLQLVGGALAEGEHAHWPLNCQSHASATGMPTRPGHRDAGRVQSSTNAAGLLGGGGPNSTAVIRPIFSALEKMVIFYTDSSLLASVC